MTVPEQPPDEPQRPVSPRRVIKRYPNRKLYDTQESRYVTLLQVAELVREGADVQVIDNATKEDKTDVTLALIISEELKARPRGIPLATLKMLIRARGERLLLQLKGGALAALFSKEEGEGTSASARETLASGSEGAGWLSDTPGDQAGIEAAASGLRATFEQWQRTVDEWQRSIDERIRAVLPSFSAFHELQVETAQLRERVAELERRLEQVQEAIPQE